MKHVRVCLFGLACAGLFASLGASGQTVVRQLENGQLSVVDYSGKPPYKRRLIDPDDGAAWERYAALADSVRVVNSLASRSGPPGKNRPSQAARIDRVPASEITRFARFEETDKPANGRLWRGAPGKGIPRHGR